jgi:hypothetical protein
MGWKTEGSEFESLEGKQFSFLHVVQTGSVAHPTSYPMGTGGSFPGLQAYNSPPTNAGAKKMWIYTSTPPYVFMA